MDIFINHFKNYYITFKSLIKWLIISTVIGSVVSLISVVFYYGMNFVTNLRLINPWLVLFLPIGGLIIVFLYKFLDEHYKIGTTLVISAIRNNQQIPFIISPLIIISTLITHLFGGSAGREGAALQLGGSLGNTLSNFFHTDEYDRHIFIMCGMASAFATLFGTPMASAIFAIEVISIGKMPYYALFPCIVSSMTAKEIAKFFKVVPEHFTVTEIPNFNFYHGFRIIILAILCTEIGVLFCIILHKTEEFFKIHFKNPYVKIIVGGVSILVLSLIFYNGDYNGTGVNVIERCFEGKYIFPLAFAIKIIFTSITLGCGYKGGEIVPSLFIGATSGYLFANLLGFSSNISVACGMIAVFCGVTNCPIASLLMSFEMFGLKGMQYYFITIAVSFLMSGYHTLYLSQQFAFPKIKNYANKLK